MDIVKSLYTLLLTLSLTITIAACSDSDSSTEDSSADVTATTESGVTVSFNTNEATVDEVFEFFYNLGGDEFTGTIRWGDNTETRVRGSGNARHIYRGDGEVSISIQVDGRESERVGIVSVSVPVEEPAPSSTTVSAVSSSFSQVGSYDCTTSGTITIQSSSGEIFDISYTASPGVAATNNYVITLRSGGVGTSGGSICPVNVPSSSTLTTVGITTNFSGTTFEFNAN